MEMITTMAGTHHRIRWPGCSAMTTMIVAVDAQRISSPMRTIPTTISTFPISCADPMRPAGRVAPGIALVEGAAITVAGSLWGPSGVSFGLPDRMIRIRCTDRADGNFANRRSPTDPPAAVEALTARRHGIIDAPWTWLDQVHGADIVTVTHPGQHAGQPADGAITDTFGAPLSVTTADCVPVVLIASHAIAVVHAGWRGVHAGIIEAAGTQLRAGGGQPIATVLGPAISAEHYAFGAEDLASLRANYGDTIAVTRADGSAGLDMSEMVAQACARVGWPRATPLACTSSPQLFSHRLRRDPERLATVAWIEPVV